MGEAMLKKTDKDTVQRIGEERIGERSSGNKGKKMVEVILSQQPETTTSDSEEKKIAVGEVGEEGQGSVDLGKKMAQAILNNEHCFLVSNERSLSMLSRYNFLL